MVIYALSRRRRDAAFTAAASGPAASDAPPCHVDPTAPFLGRAAHGSVAAAVAAVRGASGAEAAVLRVAAFRQRPSLSPTLLLPAAVEEAPVAGGAAMAGPPDATVTAVYAVPNRTDLDMAQGSGGLTAEKVKSKGDRITVTVHPMNSTPVEHSADPDVPLQFLMNEYAAAAGANPNLLRMIFCGHLLVLERTARDYNIQEGNKVYMVPKLPGSG